MLDVSISMKICNSQNQSLWLKETNKKNPTEVTPFMWKQPGKSYDVWVVQKLCIKKNQNFDIQHCECLRCTPCYFDTLVYCNMILSLIYVESTKRLS